METTRVLTVSVRIELRTGGREVDGARLAGRVDLAGKAAVEELAENGLDPVAWDTRYEYDYHVQRGQAPRHEVALA